ncbi:MAG: hypothetical protein IJ493_01160 [Clostridia bacterium]|nr:hypothetical protein [Clostridia bacterium]
MKKHTIRKSVPIGELEAYMRAWQAKKPGCVTIRSIGKSGGYDILAAVFTDRSVDDADKQRALIIAQHSGMEITGMTTALSLGNYLASAEPGAAELLRRQVIVIVPCPNPYSYAKQSPAYQFRNEAGVDEYTAFDYHGAKSGDANPSAHAIQALIDEWQPELLLDLHGVWYENQLVIESFGHSAFGSNRPYNTAFTRRVQAAGSQAGFPSFDGDFCETLLQTDVSCTDAEINAHFFPSARGAIAPTYAYLNYHTLGASFEIAWEQAGLARALEALRVGCEVWSGELYPGYPVRTAVSPYGHNSIRAWGVTAAERRASRIELWQKRGHISFGAGHPEMPGLSSVIVSLSPEINKRIAPYYVPMQALAEGMRGLVDADVERMRALLDEGYESFAEYAAKGGEGVRVEHGMTIRFGIPFADAQVEAVLYNGHEKRPGERDGYTVVTSGGWVFVDLHIPPGSVADFAVAMVKYRAAVPSGGIVEFNLSLI